MAMASDADEQNEANLGDDPGLAALVMLLRFYGIGANAEQIRHQLGMVKVGVPEMLRCAKDVGLKARAPKTTWQRLAATPMPAIAQLKDGGYLILGRAGEEKFWSSSPWRHGPSPSPRPSSRRSGTAA
jgi:subfamily B ATP-binding cassette protein HlyB/CyaB